MWRGWVPGGSACPVCNGRPNQSPSETAGLGPTTIFYHFFCPLTLLSSPLLSCGFCSFALGHCSQSTRGPFNSTLFPFSLFQTLYIYMNYSLKYEQSILLFLFYFYLYHCIFFLIIKLMWFKITIELKFIINNLFQIQWHQLF